MAKNQPSSLEAESGHSHSSFLKVACSLPSAGDGSNIIFGVPRSNHKEWGKSKDNINKQQFG